MGSAHGFGWQYPLAVPGWYAQVHVAKQVTREKPETRTARKAAELIDDDDSYGSLIELLRGAPELIKNVEFVPVTLLGCATLLAGELRTEGADDIRDKVEALIDKH